VSTGTVERVAGLRAGDLTSHPRWACTCGDPRAPFRVDSLAPRDNGTAIDVTWSHPPCGQVLEPLACVPDGFVGCFGQAEDLPGDARR
jgi:hypothetical protein